MEPGWNTRRKIMAVLGVACVFVAAYWVLRDRGCLPASATGRGTHGSAVGPPKPTGPAELVRPPGEVPDFAPGVGLPGAPPALQPGSGLWVLVADPTGRPLPDAVVELRPEGPGGSGPAGSGPAETVVTGPNGRARFAGAGEGTYGLRVTLSGYALLQERVIIPSTGALDLPLRLIPADEPDSPPPASPR